MGEEEKQLAWLLRWAWLSSNEARPATGHAVENITAMAGTMPDAPAHSANDADITAALLIVLLIYAWNCVIYRANLRVIDKNGAIFRQNENAAFLTPCPAVSRTVSTLPGIIGLFLVADALCQMNSTLTLSVSLGMISTSAVE